MYGKDLPSRPISTTFLRKAKKTIQVMDRSVEGGVGKVNPPVRNDFFTNIKICRMFWNGKTMQKYF